MLTEGLSEKWEEEKLEAMSIDTPFVKLVIRDKREMRW